MKIVISIIVIITVLGGLWLYTTQSRHYQIDAALPDNFPTESFSHQAFEQLLQQYVTDGKVDYQAWLDSTDGHSQLKRYLSAVGHFSPESHPARFATEQDALAYWIYSYNALVIHAILSNWPLESVTDIQAPIEVVKGLGFFYNQKFVVGGQSYSLYQLEQQKLVHTKADPRLHFVLNCASASCPPMRPQLPVGVALGPFLQQAASEFINDEANVYLAEDCQHLYVSRIFEWYFDDFVATNKQSFNNKAAALAHYLSGFAQPPLKNRLAQCSHIKLHYMNYDWSINKK